MEKQFENEKKLLFLLSVAGVCCFAIAATTGCGQTSKYDNKPIQQISEPHENEQGNPSAAYERRERSQSKHAKESKKQDPFVDRVYITHIVKTGETYSTIAEYYYLTAMKIKVMLEPDGRPYNMTQILEKVNCRSPRDLMPGDKIFIPSIKMPDGSILYPDPSQARENYRELRKLQANTYAVMFRPEEKPETCMTENVTRAEYARQSVRQTEKLATKKKTIKEPTPNKNLNQSEPEPEPEPEPENDECKIHFINGEETLKQKKYYEARNHFLEAIDCFGGNCDKCSEGVTKAENGFFAERYESGMDYYENQDWENAVTEFKRILELNGKYKDAKQKLNISYENLNREKNSLELSKNAVNEFDNENYGGAIELFESLLKSRKKQISDSEIKKYLYKSHLHLGLELYDNHEYLKAITQLNKAIEYNPNSIELNRYLKEIKNKFVEMHYKKGLELMNSGDVNEKKLKAAIHEFNIALSMNNNRKDILNSLNKAKKRLETLQMLKNVNR